MNSEQDSRDSQQVSWSVVTLHVGPAQRHVSLAEEPHALWTVLFWHVSVLQEARTEQHASASSGPHEAPWHKSTVTFGLGVKRSAGHVKVVHRARRSQHTFQSASVQNVPERHLVPSADSLRTCVSGHASVSQVPSSEQHVSVVAASLVQSGDGQSMSCAFALNV